MTHTTIHPGSTDLPGSIRATEAEREARALFQRTLASWVQDLLELRRRDRLGTSWSGGEADEGFGLAA